MQVENKKDLAGADWLIDYGLVLMSDHTYYCLGILWYDLVFLSGDLFRFVRVPQAENSTLKVKKVGYYPTIDKSFQNLYLTVIFQIIKKCNAHAQISKSLFIYISAVS